jgi:hypothetical protein
MKEEPTAELEERSFFGPNPVGESQYKVCGNPAAADRRKIARPDVSRSVRRLLMIC